MNKVISFVPEDLVNFCVLELNNLQQVSAYVSDTAQLDEFSRILIEKRLDFSFEDNTFAKKFSELGGANYRNDLALAYLSHHYEKSFFSKKGQKDLDEILAVESELQEFLPANDNSVFLLLFHLKNNDLVCREFGQNNYMGGFKFQEIKDILSLYKSHSHRGDWLLVLIQSLIDHFKDEAKSKIQEFQGDFKSLVNSLSREEKKTIILSHLHYGQAIDDSDYFLFNKV